jgi:hypothetical protein
MALLSRVMKNRDAELAEMYAELGHGFWNFPDGDLMDWVRDVCERQEFRNRQISPVVWERPDAGQGKQRPKRAVRPASER